MPIPLSSSQTKLMLPTTATSSTRQGGCSHADHAASAYCLGLTARSLFLTCPKQSARSGVLYVLVARIHRGIVDCVKTLSRFANILARMGINLTDSDSVRMLR